MELDQAVALGQLVLQHAAEFVLSPANRVASETPVTDRKNVVFLPFGSARPLPVDGDTRGSRGAWRARGSWPRE